MVWSVTDATCPPRYLLRRATRYVSRYRHPCLHARGPGRTVIGTRDSVAASLPACDESRHLWPMSRGSSIRLSMCLHVRFMVPLPGPALPRPGDKNDITPAPTLGQARGAKVACRWALQYPHAVHGILTHRTPAGSSAEGAFSTSAVSFGFRHTSLESGTLLKRSALRQRRVVWRSGVDLRGSSVSAVCSTLARMTGVRRRVTSLNAGLLRL
jgi:hypothetical protein